MSRRLRKPTVALMAVLAATGLGACGDSHTRVSTGTYAGESGANAPYLDVGPLTYEVQLSRQLNTAATEDAAYLQGLTAAQLKLEPGEEWFAVCIQVYNDGSKPQPAATNISIYDAQGNVYTPIVPAQGNPYAYRAGTVPAGGLIPEPGTAAAAGPSQAAVMLFKIRTVSLDNRPLELKVVNPTNAAETARAELDV